MTDFSHIASAALVWMLLGNSMRFAMVGGQALVPVGHAAWACLWCKSTEGAACLQRFYGSLDKLYIKLLSALTTTASAALVYAGILLIGSGMVVRVSGSVARYMGGERVDWETWSQATSVFSSPPLVVGMSCLIAAVSPRRTASLLMSGGFVLAGLGIGIVTASMAPQ